MIAKLPSTVPEKPKQFSLKDFFISNQSRHSVFLEISSDVGRQLFINVFNQDAKIFRIVSSETLLMYYGIRMISHDNSFLFILTQCRDIYQKLILVYKSVINLICQSILEIYIYGILQYGFKTSSTYFGRFVVNILHKGLER